MPCDTVRETELYAGKFHPAHLKAALEALGLNPRHPNYQEYEFDGGKINYATGESTIQGYATRAAQLMQTIRQTYSAQIVRSQAKRFGWTVKETGKNQLQVLKR